MGTMKKIIQKPVNWQDFESLCKKLWGEIWNCDSIKKNGRSGQSQNGIDIYGIPKNEIAYYGIQCKGKDDYSKSELKEAEIDEEISKALKFTPPLKCFIFATTANKDAVIEEYIRNKNIENIKKGSFSIDIFSWEDIADLIEENRNTYNWYINKINYKIDYDIDVLFHNGEKNIEINPKFNKNITEIIQNKQNNFDKMFNNYQDSYNSKQKFIQTIRPANYFGHKKVNYSFSKIGVCIYNIGSQVLEEYKLQIEIEDNFEKLSEDNVEYTSNMIKIPDFNKSYNFDNNNIFYKPHPLYKVLIQKDQRSFEFYIKPFPKEYSILFKWHFFAKDFDKEGENIINVKPIYEINNICKEPQKNEKIGDIIENIIDCIQDEDD